LIGVALAEIAFFIVFRADDVASIPAYFLQLFEFWYELLKSMVRFILGILRIIFSPLVNPLIIHLLEPLLNFLLWLLDNTIESLLIVLHWLFNFRLPSFAFTRIYYSPLPLEIAVRVFWHPTFITFRFARHMYTLLFGLVYLRHVIESFLAVYNWEAGDAFEVRIIDFELFCVWGLVRTSGKNWGEERLDHWVDGVMQRLFGR
jgi:hypothetical protein